MTRRVSGCQKAPLGAITLLASLAAGILLALASCQSGPADLIAQSSGEQEQAALDSLELRLLDLRLAPDAAGLAALQAELARFAGKPGLNRRVQARCASLRGEAALLAKDRPAAMGFADAAAVLADTDEGLWLVRAGLEADAAKRLAVLELGAKKAEKKSRILCERGEELFRAGRYAEAAQDLDEGLRGLDPRYRDLYAADRDRAFSMAQAARDTGSITPPEQAQTLEGQLTVRAMVERVFAETRLLSALSTNPTPAAESVLYALDQAGILLEPEAPLDSTVSRKQVAFFLWGIVARMERDPKLLKKYSLKYSVSPVSDIPRDAPWFDAALGVVEREIMDLPDGVSFKPDEPVTGLEYLGMLGRLKKQYP